MREFNDNKDNRGNNYDDCLFCPHCLLFIE